MTALYNQDFALDKAEKGVVATIHKIKEFGQTGITGIDVARYGPHRRGGQDLDDYENRRKTEKIERMLISERDSHWEIYGRNFGLKDFKETLFKYPVEILDYWESAGWEPIYFPSIDVSREKFFHDMEIGEQKLSLCEQVALGKILEPRSFDSFDVGKDVFSLRGITVLVEKEPYDFSRRILKKIKMEKRDNEKEPADIWEERIKPAFAQSLRVDPSTLRLKRIIEKFVLQFYKKKLNRKQEEEGLWEWCFEFLDTPFTRLRGNSFCLESGWYYEEGLGASYYPLAEL